MNNNNKKNKSIPNGYITLEEAQVMVENSKIEDKKDILAAIETLIDTMLGKDSFLVTGTSSNCDFLEDNNFVNWGFGMWSTVNFLNSATFRGKKETEKVNREKYDGKAEVQTVSFLEAEESICEGVLYLLGYEKKEVSTFTQ